MKIDDFDYKEHVEELKEMFRKKNLKSGMYSPYYSREPTAEDRKRYYKVYPHQAIYLKGHKAGFFEETEINQYGDYGGLVTFRRSYERAWQRGHDDGTKLRQAVLLT